MSRAKCLVGIDVSEVCVRECRTRFGHNRNAEFRVGSGSDLNGIAVGRRSRSWSFDVFVHINRPQFRSYAGEFARVLKPGGVGVIQHGGVGGAMGGCQLNDATHRKTRATFLTAAGVDSGGAELVTDVAVSAN